MAVLVPWLTTLFMYPEPITPRPSQLNARDIVERINDLICVRIDEHREMNLPIPDHKLVNSLEEQGEVIMREITDYLLAADARKGLYAKGEHE